MALPSFRRSRSKVRRRRSHDALKTVMLLTCKKCDAPVLPHRACKACGAYGDRTVKVGMDDVKKKIAKTAKKAKKSKDEDAVVEKSTNEAVTKTE